MQIKTKRKCDLCDGGGYREKRPGTTVRCFCKDGMLTEYIALETLVDKIVENLVRRGFILHREDKK